MNIMRAVGRSPPSLFIEIFKKGKWKKKKKREKGIGRKEKRIRDKRIMRLT